MSYQQLIAENQRRIMLKFLAQAPAYSLVSQHLRLAVNEVLPAPMSADAVATQLAWLEEQGLVKREKVGETTVARLKQRGLDIVEGAATMPGVERPGPEA